MAAADERPTIEESEGRPERGARTGDTTLRRDDRDDHAAGSVKQNIDRVADKVKGLLRHQD